MHSLDPAKGERVLQLVDAEALEVERRYDLRAALDAAGREDLSTAVRPLTLSPDERKVYFQVSFFHGYVTMNLRTGRVVDVTGYDLSDPPDSPGTRSPSPALPRRRGSRLTRREP